MLADVTLVLAGVMLGISIAAVFVAAMLWLSIGDGHRW
jgi:hypothetical protein